MHGGAIRLRTRSGKTRANRPASSQGLPEGGTITTPPYNAPMVGGVFPVAANLAPVREVPLLGDQPSVPRRKDRRRHTPVPRHPTARPARDRRSNARTRASFLH